MNNNDKQLQYIDFNGIAMQFAQRYFNNNIDDIKIELMHWSEQINNGNYDSYNIIKMFISLMGYIGSNEKINLNKYFSLKLNN